MYIKLKVTVEAREEKIEKVSDDHLNIWVREKAERNQANRRILDLVKEYFHASRIRLVSGHHSPSKIVSVEPD